MMFTSTKLKTMLFVSLALVSNAALPPKAQQDAEEKRIRASPHMKQMIGKSDTSAKFGITSIKCEPKSPRNIAGYSVLNQYTVSARTHGMGSWMTQQGYIDRNFTVYSVESKKSLGMPGPINFGLMFEDMPMIYIMPGVQEMYVEDPAAGFSGYVTDVATHSPWTAWDDASANSTIVTSDNKMEVYPRMDDYVGGQYKSIVLYNTGIVGYTTEHRVVGTQHSDGPAPLPFKSSDESVVTCKLVDVTPFGYCGGMDYHHEFTAKGFGRTTVTNGSTTYTVQVGLLGVQDSKEAWRFN